MKKILITGGAGFIGCNTAAYYLDRGHTVTVFDNLSRRGSEKNLSWLQEEYPQLKFIKGDIRSDMRILGKAVEGVDVVIHCAAQVAVTTSVTNPRDDFEINALGTFNVLEAVRQVNPTAFFIYTSTNKVYGGLEEFKVHRRRGRYCYANLPKGISESTPLDFHSPYGCSKGAGDQYTRDYSRIYGLKTVVLRQSCIYGPHQFGIEDQGWVSWFTIAAILGKPVTIYGDGRQVRDVLYIDDLIGLFDLAITRSKIVYGQVYNVGGGPANTLSLLELLDILERLTGRKIKRRYLGWRPGDQRVYISDVRKAKKTLGWQPKVGVEQGVARLYRWVLENQQILRRFK